MVAQLVINLTRASLGRVTERLGQEGVQITHITGHFDVREPKGQLLLGLARTPEELETLLKRIRRIRGVTFVGLAHSVLTDTGDDHAQDSTH